MLAGVMKYDDQLTLLSVSGRSDGVLRRKDILIVHLRIGLLVDHLSDETERREEHPISASESSNVQDKSL